MAHSWRTTNRPAAQASRARACARCRRPTIRWTTQRKTNPLLHPKADTMGVDLPLIWAIIIIFGIMMYVVMDGFDLGIGLLYPFVAGKDERDVMMNTVAPVWDGNETWLVLGGAGLLAAFPLAYSVVLSAFYLPIIFMLLGLIFRGVAFEFRFKASDAHRPWWDKAFIGGSAVATFCQGMILGAYISGVKVVDRVYAGGAFDWFAPFPLFVG